jgi:deazaflavin-dependent oxidoreductase (nitroreductase family)
MTAGANAARFSSVANKKTVRLTHYGRKSGKPYQVTIWFLADGDQVFLTTMNMARQWTQNVQKRPEIELEIGGERFKAKVEAVVSDDAEMKRVVELMKRKYPISRPYLWIKGRPDGAFRVKLE